MKRTGKIWALLLLTGVIFSFAPATTGWKVGSDYNISFSATGVSGIFKTFSGTIDFDPANLSTSKFAMTINVASINTGNAMQNKHAKSADWFDAEKYPDIKFASGSFQKTSGGYSVKGKLTIKNVTKEETIPFTFTKNGTKGKFVAKFSVNRIDYGVGKSGNDVGNTIKIEATIPVTKK